MTKMLRTIDGWRFEAPLALLLAAATAFMVLVMPSELVETIPGAVNLGGLMQPVLAVIAAVAAGGVALLAMVKAGSSRRRSGRAASVYVDANGDEHPYDIMPVAVDPEPVIVLAPAPEPAPVAPVTAEPAPRIRRADAHPDFPPRAPILATRDLGEPFMEVGGFVAPPEAPAIPDGDYVELPSWLSAHEAPAADAADAHQPETPETVAEEPAIEEIEDAVEPVAAPAETPIAIEPVAEPAPAAEPIPFVEPAPLRAARPERQSIAEMMARLDAGMSRRAKAAPVRDARPALRDALAELNRLASRG